MDKLANCETENLICEQCKYYGGISVCYNDSGSCDNFFMYQNIFDKLDAYEYTNLTPERVDELAEAEHDGRVVVLPCKVGDVVYMPINENYVKEYVVKSFCIENNNTFLCIGVMKASVSLIGESIFLTRAEAEDALAQQAVTRGEMSR